MSHVLESTYNLLMKYIKDSKDIIPNFEPKTDPFGDNVSGEQAYKRTERIVSAVYLVTNHIPAADPLRTRLRLIGHELLDEVVALHGGFRAATSGRIAQPLSLIRECMTLARLLFLGGYVSDQNVQIILSALDDLGLFLSGSQQSTLSDTIQLKREDFVPQLNRHTPSPLLQRVFGREASIRKNETITKSVPTPSKTPKVPGRSVQTEVHNERHTMILDILSRGGKLGIKDITSQMVNCSEKTVQRELAVLIGQKKVKKEGEKRWSHYVLVSSAT